MSTRAEAARVPVEHRWLGLDRRSVPYALVAFAVIALWAWVAPWVSSQVAWDDPVRAGQAIQVTDDVTMSAAPGWGVVKGLRTTDRTRSGAKAADQVVLVKDGVVLSILPGPFSGSVTRLLSQAERITGAGTEGYHVSGDVRDVATSSGLHGVAQDFSAPRNVGTVTTFVVGDNGIEIQVAGPEAQVTALADETRTMIDSLARSGGES